MNCNTTHYRANSSSVPGDPTSIEGGPRFYSPVRRMGGGGLQGIYIHSKMAMIDDRIAFVGTSNFTYRSMVYDGEISVCIDGDLVRNIRHTLFAHYGLNVADVPTDWDVQVGRFTRSGVAGVGVVALPLNQLPTAIPAIPYANFTLL